MFRVIIIIFKLGTFAFVFNMSKQQLSFKYPVLFIGLYYKIGNELITGFLILIFNFPRSKTIGPLQPEIKKIAAPVVALVSIIIIKLVK